jgi:fatty acid desaturase
VARTRFFFRYTAYDVFPMLSGVGIVVYLIACFLLFDRMSWWVIVPAFLGAAYTYLWNLQCISHNFIHNPFFRSKWLNRGYGVLETVALGVPHVLYHHYHMNHHFGDNDAKGPDGTTKDWSSIYRHARDQGPESFWRYVLLGFWRVEVGPVVRTAAKHHHLPQLAVETLVLGAFWVTMALVDWRFFVFFYLPSYYLGWTASYAEGYVEHFGCKPGNPFANSVSTYNRLYNLAWFNNGYHQEHHWDPKWHWTRMHELHEKIRPEMEANGTRIVKGPHLTALVEDWWAGRTSQAWTDSIPTEAEPAKVVPMPDQQTPRIAA